MASRRRSTASSAASHQFVRSLALLLTLCTGFTGLVYEVVWHKYLANLIGSQARAAAVIIAVFLGGLSIGYFVFGAVARNRSPRALVRVCGVVEIGIGIWALLFPLLYAFVWRTIGIVDVSSSFMLVSDVLLAMLLLGPPTVLMGGTLPLLTQGLSADLDDAAPFHAKIYAVNTGGAFLGCLLAGFWFLPAWGLPRSMIAMGVINLVAGCSLVALSRLISNELPQLRHSAVVIHPRGEQLSIFPALFIAFCSGFCAICLQTIFIRLVGMSVGSSEYAFSMIVSAFIFALAIGAWRVGQKVESPLSLWTNQLLVVVGASIVYLLVPYWPYGAHVIRTLFTDEDPSFYAYHVVVFAVLVLLLLLPVGSIGRTLPILFREMRGRFDELGVAIGRIYGANTLGCVLGALVGGYLLLYYIDLTDIYRICLGISSMLLLIALPTVRAHRGGSGRRLLFAGLVSLGTTALIATLPAWPREYFATGTFRNRTALEYSYSGATEFYKQFLRRWNVLAYKDDPNTTVSVIEVKKEYAPEIGKAGQLARSLWVNGKSDGNTVGKDLRTTRLVAHLPALLHTAASRRAAVIGLGTGITAGSLTLYPDLDQIDCIEISPFVRAYATYFDHVSHDVSKSPKLNWYVDDAYRVLGSSKERYAVIVSEPSNPWVTGVERLYTKEFYEIVKERLDTGGMYAQWIQTYLFSEQSLGIVIKTFSSVFPHLHLFHNDADLILVGSMQPFTNRSLAQLASRFSVPQIQQDMKEVFVESVPALLGMELWLPSELFADSGDHTLDFPTLAFSAGRDFYRGDDMELNTLSERKRFRQRSRSFLKQTLYFDWLSTQQRAGSNLLPFDDATLASYAANVCEQYRPHFTEGWRYAPFPCQTALVALAARNTIVSEGRMPSEDLTLVRELTQVGSGDLHRSAVSSLSAICSVARVYGEFNSALLGITGERVARYIEAYSRSDAPVVATELEQLRECRVDLLNAFVWNGEVIRAREQLEILQRMGNIEANRFAELRQVVDRAEQIEGEIRVR